MTPKFALLPISILAAALLVGCGDDSSSAPSEPIVDTVPPATPADVSVDVIHARAVLSWTENAEPDLAGYALERSLDGGESWTVISTSLTNATYNDDLRSQATYHVAARDETGNQSAFSGAVSYTAGPHPKFPEQPMNHLP
jgi:hypothetical protein